MNFKSSRLSVVLLGDRLAIAALWGSRVEAFIVDAESPAPALRAVDVALRLAEDARLRPLSLTVAAHNLPTLARLPRDSHVAWVHCAAGATELLFLIGDALVFSRGLAGTDDALVAEELQRSLLALRWRGYDAVWVSGAADAPHAR